jgi:long-chain acyl-CoA synthetase
MARQSILDFFLESVEQQPARTAVLTKVEGTYRAQSWGDLGSQVRTLATALLALDIEPGSRVCIMAQTHLQWVLLDLAIVHAGCTTVPIYASNTPDECQYIGENSGCVVVFTDNAAQTQKFMAERARLPLIKKVVQLHEPVAADPAWVMDWPSFLALGQQSHEACAAQLDARRRSITKDSLLTIIYTSGTTGRPKGVMTTHDNMLSVAEAIADIDVVRPSDVQLLFLPLAHVFAKVLMVAWLATQHVLAFAQHTDTLKEDLLDIRPTLMAGVPRIFEKFYAAVVKKGQLKGGVQRLLFDQALALSEKNGEAQAMGSNLPWYTALQFRALQALVFKKIAQGLAASLGGRMRIMVSGGAPLSTKIAWFFRDAGLELLEGWGLTETAAATCINRAGNNRIGTVGQPLPGMAIKLAADGEILLQGRGIMAGYWQNPTATAEVISEGWFATGDIGKLDADGSLRIVDRKKDLIVTAGGKNIAPQNLENLLKTHKLISQVVVHGDKRKYVSALVTLDPEALRLLAQELGLGGASYAELTQRQEVHSAVEQVFAAFNKQLAKYETIKKFKILEHDFSQETGELTASLKIKRKLINQRYKAVFDAFYEESY